MELFAPSSYGSVRSESAIRATLGIPHAACRCFRGISVQNFRAACPRLERRPATHDDGHAFGKRYGPFVSSLLDPKTASFAHPAGPKIPDLPWFTTQDLYLGGKALWGPFWPVVACSRCSRNGPPGTSTVTKFSDLTNMVKP